MISPMGEVRDRALIETEEREGIKIFMSSSAAKEMKGTREGRDQMPGCILWP